MLPIVIVSPVIAAGSEAAVAAVVESSFLEQDEKDNVRIIKISNEIFIFILFFSIKSLRSGTKKSNIQTFQSNWYTHKN